MPALQPITINSFVTEIDKSITANSHFIQWWFQIQSLHGDLINKQVYPFYVAACV